MHTLQILDGAGATQRERAAVAARQLEQVFEQMLVASMRSGATAAGEPSLFGSGAGAGTYTAWFDQHLAEHLSRGRGIGIAATLLRGWERAGLIDGGTDGTA